MRLFLDCEFNGFKGELISMALVAEDGREWYEVIPCRNPCEWVAENVMPILDKSPLRNVALMSKSLARFLKQFDSIHIVADWPEDIQHFCSVLIVGPGKRINTPPLSMEILRIDSKSEVPHNALSDARGICDHVCQTKQRSSHCHSLPDTASASHPHSSPSPVP